MARVDTPETRDDEADGADDGPHARPDGNEGRAAMRNGAGVLARRGRTRLVANEAEPESGHAERRRPARSGYANASR
jgi:hypothetical protein